jgi:hypothetical protein
MCPAKPVCNAFQTFSAVFCSWWLAEARASALDRRNEPNRIALKPPSPHRFTSQRLLDGR